MSLKNIRKKPQYIDGVGDVFPIEIKNYDEFQECSSILYLSKGHFRDGQNYKLLDLILLGFVGEERKNNIDNLEKLFKLVLKKDVKFIVNEKDGVYGFLIDNKEQLSFFDTEERFFICSENYEELREIIMNQNIMHEQKIYKDEITREYAQLVLEARAKKCAKISFESIMTTVSNSKKVSYEDLDNFSIYQLYSDFYRIRKDRTYDTATLFRSVGAEVELEDFAEDLDLYHNPYTDLFVNDDILDKFDKK